MNTIVIDSVSCIYAIRNKTNLKKYIGSAVNNRQRWAQHRSYLRRNTHPNKYLQSAWNKYGEDSFEFVVLEIVRDKKKLLEREQEWLDKGKPEYNLFPTAGSPFGARWKLSKETKAKQGKAQKGKTVSAITRMKLRIVNLGKTMSTESRKKISIANKGHKHGNGRLGKKHSDATKEKMSKAQLGKKKSPEAVAHWKASRWPNAK